jgi:hypothetical protein
MGTKSESEAMDEAVTEFTVDELREFLEADQLPVPADPEFKERLRQRLWALVSARAAQRRDPEGGG